MRRVVAYCLPWHLSKSDAFHDLFIRPLSDRLAIDVKDFEQVRSWDAEPRDAPLVFCQVYPPRELLDDPRRQLVWIPMWDTVRNDGEAFWRALPSSLRVVAFSAGVAADAEAAGLPALRITHHQDPAALGQARWEDGPVVFYWNRTGLVGPAFLSELCAAVGARRLLFRDELDYAIPHSLHYELPSLLGAARVERVAPCSRAAYLEAIDDANVVVAPRATEGVGMILLEAMARGCAVLAHDAPTMNEYIRHKDNGYLFGRSDGLARRRRLPRRRSRFVLPAERDWSDLAAVDLQELGARARADEQRGHAEWLAALPGYARFVGDW